jgi:glycosyltransferase involved in cell wall biosynthesis
MGPYVSPILPGVLSIHEVGYTALVGSAFETAHTLEEAVPRVDELIRSFHYFSTELPSLVRHLVTLTEEDAAALTPFADARVYVNASGVDVDDEPESIPLGPGGAPILSYAGNFQHPPNTRAVTFFAEKVMPLLLERFPSAELRVYGSKMSNEIRALDGKNGVRVLGFVEDLRAALRESTAMVAPLFTGTGMRIKVMEALGAGALVIGTDLSIRGTGLVDGAHFLRANTAAEFVGAICQAVEQPDLALSIARAGQELVGTTHSWEAAARRREAIWFAALADGARDAQEPTTATGLGADP